jgi:hypothetical protein
LKQFAFTLDLETDYAGYMDSAEIFEQPDRIEELLSALSSLDVKITVFTVGNLFELYPNIIRLFEKYNCEFEAHSYSHDFSRPDTEQEIIRSREAYYNYFKRYPIGYRSPRGLISPQGIKMLDKHGFLYDSSIFPSYFPNPFRYLFSKQHIHYHDGTKIMEIPFTSVSLLRLTLSISYIKLFGVEFFIWLSRFFGFPDVICFDSHLHDFIHIPKSYNKLSLFWQILYRRNMNSGTEQCLKFLKHAKEMGYEFCYMSEIYEKNKKQLP